MSPPEAFNCMESPIQIPAEVGMITASAEVSVVTLVFAEAEQPAVLVTITV